MTKIALIRLPSKYDNWHKRPPLGLSYLAGILERKAFECKIFDGHFHRWSTNTLEERVRAYSPDVLGITAMTHEITRAAEFATRIKKTRSIPVIVGGCHVTALPAETLTEFPIFDYGIVGEGEKSAVKLLEILFGRPESDLSEVDGLIYKNISGIIVNKPVSPLTAQELDGMPFPAFHQYYNSEKKNLLERNQCYPIMASRGCPYRCAFCMRVLGNKLRRRSPENLCTEIEFAIFRYGAHTFDFQDELFLNNDEHTKTTLQFMIDSRLSNRIRWSALTRANAVNSDLVSLAKQAGCYHLEMGVESGDDNILRSIGKGITVAQVKKAVEIIKRAGISLCTYFIIGHPGETKETATRTMELAVRLNTDRIAVGIMVPYPGTKIYEMAKRGEGGYRLLSDDWEMYDKYGGRSLETVDLKVEQMEKLQWKTYLEFYLKNYKLKGLTSFLWSRRRGVLYMLRRRLSV